MVWHARAMAAVALRESGNIGMAEQRMREILRDCPVLKVRANLLAGYARGSGTGQRIGRRSTICAAGFKKRWKARALTLKH